MSIMASVTFDDPALLAALRTFVRAVDALDAAGEDADVLLASDAKALAGLNLRKRLVELGWTPPVRQGASSA
jgi:hypothetical protein